MASLQLHWVQRGAASSMVARRVADTLLAGHADSIIPRWIGFAWYTLVLAGGLTIALAGAHAKQAAVARVVAAAVAALVTLAILLGLRATPTLWSGGALAAVLGSATLLAGALHALPASRGRG